MKLIYTNNDKQVKLGDTIALRSSSLKREKIGMIIKIDYNDLEYIIVEIKNKSYMVSINDCGIRIQP